MSLIEVTEGDYGSEVSVTLYQNDTDVTVEDLNSVTTVNISIGRKDESFIVDNAEALIFSKDDGIVYFTPSADWFTNLGGIYHYMAVFKITYTTGIRRSFSIPLYVHPL